MKIFVYRCSICNCSNNPTVETNPGEYRKGIYFLQDPTNTSSMICSECADSIRDIQWEDDDILNKNEPDWGEIEVLDQEWEIDTQPLVEGFEEDVDDSL